MSSTVQPEINTDAQINLGNPYNVILFNDDHHSIDEVISQVIKATGYDPIKATNITMKAHSEGSAIVWTGHKERAEHIASILEEIKLQTKVEPA